MKSTHSIYPSLLKVAVAVSIVTGSLASASAAGNMPTEPSQYILHTDRLIVKYKDADVGSAKARVATAMTAGRQAIADRAGQQLGLRLQALRSTATGAHVFKIDRKVSVAEADALAKEMMARDNSIEYAEPDRIMRKMATPTDPMYTQQWHYYETTGGLRLPAAWDLSTGTGVKVAVIDTGIRPHADLAGQYVGGYDFISDATIGNDGNGRDADPTDPGDWTAANECAAGEPASNSSWHGTHVAGTIAAATNNGVGVAGVAYGAKVVPVRVLGKCGGYTSDIADAIIWASGGTVTGVPANANVAKVINMSLGGGGACGTTTQNAINSARSRGTVVIVAAGNENQNASNSNPANCAGVVAVAATNRNGAPRAVLELRHRGRRRSPRRRRQRLHPVDAERRHQLAWRRQLRRLPGHLDGDPARRRRGCADAGEEQRADPGRHRVETQEHGARLPGHLLAVRHRYRRRRRRRRRRHHGDRRRRSRKPSRTTRSPPRTPSHQPAPPSTATMSATTDTDYFVVQLPAGKTLQRDADPGFDHRRLRPVHLQQRRYAAGPSENGAGATDTASVANTTSATSARYVRVKYYSGGTGATNGKYTLKLNW